MGVNFKLIFILTGLIFILSSCRTSAPRLDYQALARASILLGVDINMEDNHKLYRDSPTRYTGKYTVLRFREIPKT